MYRRSPNYKTVKKIYDNTSLDEYVYKIIEKTKKPKSIKLGNKEVEYFEPSEYEIVKIPASADNLKKINIRGTLKEGNSSGRFYMAHLEQRRKDCSFLYKVLICYVLDVRC